MAERRAEQEEKFRKREKKDLGGDGTEEGENDTTESEIRTGQGGGDRAETRGRRPKTKRSV